MAIFSKKPSTSYLGIDISNDAVKVVELKNFEGKPQLVTYGYSDYKSKSSKGSFIENINVTSTLLKEICEKSNCKARNVIAALPTSKTYNYVLKIPQILKKDLEDSVKIKSILSKEISKLLPKPLEEMQFDYTIVNNEKYVGLNANDLSQNVKFLITVASNEVVKQYSQIFSQTGLNLVSLDIESFSLVRSLVGNDKSLIMIVDFGGRTTDLSMIESGVPVLNRSVDIGGRDVTKKLSSVMNINEDEAEQYKLDLSILMKQQNLKEIPKPIELVLAPIVSEIEYLIKSYYGQVSSDKKIDRIILTGGGSLLSGLTDYIEKRTNVRTYIGDPWARVIYPKELTNLLKEVGSKLSVAIGLAMTKIK